MKKKELLFLEKVADMPYNWSVGLEGSYFLNEIYKNRRILGIKCHGCQTVYLPPRRVCGRCHLAINEWVQVAEAGTLASYTVVNYKFIDPNTGVPRPVPYTYAYIKLDGADTPIIHFLNETNPEKLKPGMRVKAVFNDQPCSTLEAILHFEVIS